MSDSLKIDITQLVNDHTEEMVRYTIGKVSSSDDAQDIVQDTFIAAYGAAEKFKGDSNPKTWLYGILKHKILDHHRKMYRKPRQVEIAEENQDAFFDANGSWNKESQPQTWSEEPHLLDNPDFNKQLKICIEKLPTKQGIAIQLKYQNDINTEDIRKELGITATNYWQLLHRAKLQLRGCLNENWFKQ